MPSTFSTGFIESPYSLKNDTPWEEFGWLSRSKSSLMIRNPAAFEGNDHNDRDQNDHAEIKKAVHQPKVRRGLFFGLRFFGIARHLEREYRIFISTC